MWGGRPPVEKSLSHELSKDTISQLTQLASLALFRPLHFPFAGYEAIPI